MRRGAVENLPVDPLEVLTHVPLPEQCAVLGLMLLSTVWAVYRSGPWPLVALAACMLVWSRANSALEGVVLVTFGHGRGLTLADVLVPALLGAVLLAHDRRRARRDGAREAAHAGTDR